jgi:hypothetical protein
MFSRVCIIRKIIVVPDDENMGHYTSNSIENYLGGLALASEHIHHHQPNIVPIAGAQTFLMDYT